MNNYIRTFIYVPFEWELHLAGWASTQLIASTHAPNSDYRVSCMLCTHRIDPLVFKHIAHCALISGLSGRHRSFRCLSPSLSQEPTKPAVENKGKRDLIKDGYYFMRQEPLKIFLWHRARNKNPRTNQTSLTQRHALYLGRAATNSFWNPKCDRYEDKPRLSLIKAFFHADSCPHEIQVEWIFQLTASFEPLKIFVWHRARNPHPKFLLKPAMW